MKTSRIVLGIGVAMAVIGALQAGCAESTVPPVQSPIPYVATRNDAIRDMLWIAGVGKDDVVYDLGSGDGRIVIAAVRDFGARRAVGVEIDAARIRESRENAQKAGVQGRVEFIQGDLFTTDFRQASVVTLFLGHEANIKLRPRMFSTLTPGTRIVSHQFAMGEWQPDKALTVRTVCLGMWGDHMRLECKLDGIPYGRFQMRFDGHVQGDRMQGTLAMTDRGELQEHAWEAHRDKADLTGAWEWQRATGERSVRLRIEQRGGQLVATYVDNQTVPVTDFYDCGGGFYFTLLIGRERGGLRIAEDTGWLIGEGVLDHGELVGTIEFYPHSDKPGRPGGIEASRGETRDWAPRKELTR